MKDRITRNRKGVLHVNGTPVRVPKSADYTDTEALQYVEKCAEWAPGARQATRAREKEHYAAQRARAKAFCEASLLERLAALPVSPQAAAAARRQWGISG